MVMRLKKYCTNVVHPDKLTESWAQFRQLEQSFKIYKYANMQSV